MFVKGNDVAVTRHLFYVSVYTESADKNDIVSSLARLIAGRPAVAADRTRGAAPPRGEGPQVQVGNARQGRAHGSATVEYD